MRGADSVAIQIKSSHVVCHVMATAIANNCLHLPSPVVAIAFAPSAQLVVASDDGTVRLYHPPYSKVSKAVRNLGCEISSLAFSPGGRDIWVACGQRVSTLPFVLLVFLFLTVILRFFAFVLRHLK